MNEPRPTIMFLLLAGAAACSSGRGHFDGNDGLDMRMVSPDLRAPVDAALPSQLTWGKPLPIQGMNLNTAALEAHPSMTRDMLRLCFTSNRADANAKGDLDIYCATRTRREDPFSQPVNQVDINTSFVDWMPGLSFDGNEMFFQSNRTGGVGDQDVYRAVWDAAKSRYVAATLVPGVNSTAWDGGPALSPDALILYQNSLRDGFGGIYQARRPDRASDFGAVTLLMGFNQFDGEPAMAHDDKLLVFCSAGRNGAPKGDMAGSPYFMLWGSGHQGTSYGTPFSLLVEGMPIHACGPELLSDGSLMFHTSDRPEGAGGDDLYIARLQF